MRTLLRKQLCASVQFFCQANPVSRCRVKFVEFFDPGWNRGAEVAKRGADSAHGILRRYCGASETDAPSRWRMPGHSSTVPGEAERKPLQHFSMRNIRRNSDLSFSRFKPKNQAIQSPRVLHPQYAPQFPRDKRKQTWVFQVDYPARIVLKACLLEADTIGEPQPALGKYTACP